MRTDHPVLRWFRLATITLSIAVVGLIGMALFNRAPSASLTGRLVPGQRNGDIPLAVFDEKRFLSGFSAPADTQVFFNVPAGIRLSRLTMLGGPLFDRGRYWGYAFSGNEQKNKDAGKRGRDLYDGHFFFSTGEREAKRKQPPGRGDIIGLLESSRTDSEPKRSEIDVFEGPRTIYLMSSLALPVGTDTDADDLNDPYERQIGTLPDNPDTDGDTLSDYQEMYITHTSPLLRDTDNDGLSDSCEDKNQNGAVDPDETSPSNRDTDRDGLCDGNGTASGCGEGTLSPIRGEDMNQNCQVDAGETDPTKEATFNGVHDWTYKWNKLQEAKGKK